MRGIQFDRIVLLVGVEKMRTGKSLQLYLLCLFPTAFSKHLHEHEEFLLTVFINSFLHVPYNKQTSLYFSAYLGMSSIEWSSICFWVSKHRIWPKFVWNIFVLKQWVPFLSFLWSVVSGLLFFFVHVYILYVYSWTVSAENSWKNVGAGVESILKFLKLQYVKIVCKGKNNKHRPCVHLVIISVTSFHLFWTCLEFVDLPH